MWQDIELPFILMVTGLGDAVKPGMVHEEINPFHSTLLLNIVTKGVSESPVPLFVSAGSSYLIPPVRKEIEFSGGDVGTQ